MLTIYGNRQYGGFCDRVARRDFLKIGGMALGGLALPDVMRLEAAQGSKSHKAIINVFLPGGPPHIDMWDLKPNAPAEIRGEYSPIKTSVPGMEICELRKQLADFHSRNARLDRAVFATNFRRSVRLQIPHVDMRRPTRQKDIDDRLVRLAALSRLQPHYI